MKILNIINWKIEKDTIIRILLISTELLVKNRLKSHNVWRKPLSKWYKKLVTQIKNAI
jgi:hypothetical protein